MLLDDLNICTRVKFHQNPVLSFLVKRNEMMNIRTYYNISMI